MASIAARAEAGFEPIPGYVLREKLGQVDTVKSGRPTHQAV